MKVKFIEDLLEAPLTLAQRKDFGLPSQKKYPMPDKKHVYLAIAYFNHCKPEYEKELAGNILKYMKKFKISSVNLSPTNRFRKYFKNFSIRENSVFGEFNKEDFNFYESLV